MALVLNRETASTLAAAAVLIWGTFPTTPRLLARRADCPISQWLNVFLVLYPTVGKFNVGQTLTSVAVLMLLKAVLDAGEKSTEDMYYSDMYRLHPNAEQQVEGRG